MPTVRHATLADASVSDAASVAEAARVLFSAAASAVAVLQRDGRVVGVFTEHDLIGALVPPYLLELRHTAFTQDDIEALAQRAAEVGAELVTAHMSEAPLIESDTSITHAAERFLHERCAALAVVEGKRFVGMLSRSELARLLLRPAGAAQ